MLLYMHDHCPFDYCIVDTVPLLLNLSHPDDQCAFNRSGILCGACQSGLSQVLGTSKCMKCPTWWIIIMLVCFAIAGIVLVVLLMVFNLTVATGTTNGIIFYANIVRANQAIFFPHYTTNTSSFLSWLIAWLNLDIGVQSCLYNGLDAYAKVWLQFLFPIYVWLIVILIIVSCHYSTIATKLNHFGDNAVQVLATLFLLSYTKLLRIIIIAFSSITLNYPDGHSIQVWMYDGNVHYLKGKHLVLFVAALAVLIFISVPYTTILLCVQWLQRFSHLKLLTWIHRLMPLFDAYTGPYKLKHCYWTGFLLLVRVILFTVFSVNTSGDPAVNHLAISTTSVVLLAYLSLIGGVYKLLQHNLIGVSIFLNLGILASGTLFQSGSPSESITYISTAMIFIQLIVIILFHIHKRIIKHFRFSRLQLKRHLLQAPLLDESDPTDDNSALQAPNVVTHTTIDLKELIENKNTND